MSRIPGVGMNGTSGPGMRALNISQFVGQHTPGGIGHDKGEEQSSSVGFDNSGPPPNMLIPGMGNDQYQ